MACTQFLVDKLGAATLPEGLIGVEAERGNLPLVKYLHTLPGQRVRPEVLREVYVGLRLMERGSYARATDFRPERQPALYPMLLFLLQHRPEASTLSLEDHAFRCGDVMILKVVECIRGRLSLTDVREFKTFPLHLNVELVCFLAPRVPVEYSSRAVDEAAANGQWDLLTSAAAPNLECTAAGVAAAAQNSHWDVVEQLLRQDRSLVLSPVVMDYAARDGRLDVVTTLHETRDEGCTPSALDWAAANGHLEVFRFLREKRDQDSTFRAMDLAVKNRQSAMIQLLLESDSPELCSTAAMDHAAANGDLAMVSYLHENRPEGCTTDAIDLAAANGHVDVVQFLLKNRTEGFTAKAIYGAMHRGYGKSREWDEWLDDQRNEPRAAPHLRTGDRRHLQVLELLFASRPDLFMVSDMASFLVCGAFELWLSLKDEFPDHGGEREAMAEAGARGFLSTIRFLVDVQGRKDLLHVALAAAVMKSPAWFGVLRRLYPDPVPSWDNQRGPRLVNSMAYSYKVPELRRFICLCPDPFQYFEALRAGRFASEIVDRLDEWTPTAQDIASAQATAETEAEASFYLEEGVPDWMIEQDIFDADLSVRGLKSDLKDEFGSELTWPIWAVYRHNLAALETILRLAQTPKYACDPKFSFANARSRAIRIGRLDILQWLLTHATTHEPVEPTLLDDAIFYQEDVEIATWLAEHYPSGCTQFGLSRPWPVPPMQCGLNEFTLDRIEQNEKLRALVDFGALAAYAAEQGNLTLLKRLHDTYTDAFMHREDLVDRAVRASADAKDFVTTSAMFAKRLRAKEGADSVVAVAREAADRVEAACDAARGRTGALPVLRYLQQLGYAHVSTVAMDNVRRDDNISVLYYLYKHFKHGGYTIQAIKRRQDMGHDIGIENIIRLHLLHHGLSDDHGAWDEAMTAAYTQADWLVESNGFPSQRMWEDLKHFGYWLHTNGWKEPLTREWRAPSFYYKRIVEKRGVPTVAKQSPDTA